VPSLGLGLSFDEHGVLDYIEIWKPLTLMQRFLRQMESILGKAPASRDYLVKPLPFADTAETPPNKPLKQSAAPRRDL